MPDDFSSSLFGFYPSPVVLDKSMISAPAGFSVSMGAGRGQEPMRVLKQNGSFMETCSSACKIQASDSCSSGHCVSRNASLPDDQPHLFLDDSETHQRREEKDTSRLDIHLGISSVTSNSFSSVLLLCATIPWGKHFLTPDGEPTKGQSSISSKSSLFY